MEENLTSNTRSAGKMIGELSRAAHIYFQSEFKQYSIGHAQIRTLLFIAKNEGSSQLEISKHLKLDKSSITSQLQLLEKNGYISRHIADHDARMHKLSITEKTRDILEPIKKAHASWTSILLDGFSENEKTELFTYLEKMLSNAKKK
jgi:DNA-binding MarR family transcriptional regulator